MSRPKGGKNRTWSKEEKLRIIKRHLEDYISQIDVAKEEGISSGMISNWVKRYIEEGEEGLENKKSQGNPYTALYTSKNLSEVERLRLEIMKKDIEIARLKKGYQVKGVGANKEYVTSKGKSIK